MLQIVHHNMFEHNKIYWTCAATEEDISNGNSCLVEPREMICKDRFNNEYAELYYFNSETLEEDNDSNASSWVSSREVFNTQKEALDYFILYLNSEIHKLIEHRDNLYHRISIGELEC